MSINIMAQNAIANLRYWAQGRVGVFPSPLLIPRPWHVHRQNSNWYYGITNKGRRNQGIWRPRCTSCFRALKNQWLIYYNTCPQNLELDYLSSDKLWTPKKTERITLWWIQIWMNSLSSCLLDGVDVTLIAFQLVIRYAQADCALPIMTSQRWVWPLASARQTSQNLTFFRRNVGPQESNK